VAESRACRMDYAEAIRGGGGFAKPPTRAIARRWNGWGVPQDYAEAMRWFRQAADAGNSSAMNNIGLLYQNGEGVPQDYAEAMRWFRKAADAGNSAAMNNIGYAEAMLYANGWGVPQDYAEAMRWYLKAADAGNSAAKDNLDRLNNLIAQQSKTGKL
jgi:TPR repeat protein